MRKITKHIIEAHERPFDWRKNNCIHAAAEVINYYHKCDCISEFGFDFADTEQGNFAALKAKGHDSLASLFDAYFAVSYTHLTLPTIYSV